MEAWHIWVIAGVILVILEMFTIGFVLASFGVACLLAAIPAALGWELNGQLAVFAVVSLVLIFAVRPLFQKGIYRLSEPRRIGAAALVGQSGVVVERVGDSTSPGRVKVGAEEWRAVTVEPSYSFEPGTAIEVVAIDSATLVVRAI
jgi:membrane protein implicated in regulation of membrane protease activity